MFQLLKRIYGNVLVAPEDGKPNRCSFHCYFYWKNFGLTVCCCSSLKGTIFHCSLTWRLFPPTKRRWYTRQASSRETASLLSLRSTLSSRRRVEREKKGLLSITGMTSLCKLLLLCSKLQDSRVATNLDNQLIFFFFVKLFPFNDIPLGFNWQNILLTNSRQ